MGSGAWLEFLTFAFLASQENLSEGTAQEWMRTPMSIFAAVQK